MLFPTTPSPFLFFSDLPEIDFSGRYPVSVRHWCAQNFISRQCWRWLRHSVHALARILLGGVINNVAGSPPSLWLTRFPSWVESLFCWQSLDQLIVGAFFLFFKRHSLITAFICATIYRNRRKFTRTAVLCVCGCFTSRLEDQFISWFLFVWCFAFCLRFASVYLDTVRKRC